MQPHTVLHAQSQRTHIRLDSMTHIQLKTTHTHPKHRTQVHQGLIHIHDCISYISYFYVSIYLKLNGDDAVGGGMKMV